MTRPVFISLYACSFIFIIFQIHFLQFYSANENNLKEENPQNTSLVKELNDIERVLEDPKSGNKWNFFAHKEEYVQNISHLGILTKLNAQPETEAGEETKENNSKRRIHLQHPVVEWLNEEGISTQYSSDVDLVRQLAARMSFYGESIEPSEIQKLTVTDIWKYFQQTNIKTESSSAKRYLKLITQNSEYVMARLHTGGWQNVQRWSKYFGGHDIALVSPFHAGELPKIKLMLESWKMFPPCVDFLKAGNVSVHFVWAFAGNFSNESGRVIQKTLQRLIHATSDIFQCFASINYISLAQPASLGHLDGACISFHLLMHMFQNTPLVAFQLMETDVRPIRKGWISELVKVADAPNACKSWWVKGSPSLCTTSYAPPKPIDAKRDYHLNGNALYALNCPAFNAFLVQTQKFYPPRPDKGWEVQVAGGCETGRINEGGYDHIMHEYRFEVENFVYSRMIMNKFVFTYFLANFCEQFYDALEVQDLISETYLVHSKSVQLSKFTRQILLAFSEMLERPATVEEMSEPLSTLLPLLFSGEVKNSDLPRLAVKAGKDLSLKPPDTSPENWEVAFRNQLYFLTLDFHTGPISCQMPIFQELGVVTHAEVDFGNCIYSGYCKNRIKVLSFDAWKGFSLESEGRSQEKLIKEFYRVYKKDPEMTRVDAFICSHPVANCQLFIPFNKTIILHATTRLEFGRHDGGVFWRLAHWTHEKGAIMWQKWLHDFQIIASSPKNIIAANNLYDVNYIEYFTGIRPLLIKSWCGDLNYEFTLLKTKSSRSLFQPYPSYLPVENTFLIGAYRTNLDLYRNGTTTNSVHDHFIAKQIFNAKRRGTYNYKLVFMQEELDGVYNMADLCKYQGIVVLPYQVSTISILEFYRLNIPLFFPSKALLVKWHSLDPELLWERIYGWPSVPWSTLQSPMHSQAAIPNPNDNTLESFSYWINFCDWYNFPHIQLFGSVEQLLKMLDTVNLADISSEMEHYNINERNELKEFWKGLLEKTFDFRPPEE